MCKGRLGSARAPVGGKVALPTRSEVGCRLRDLPRAPRAAAKGRPRRVGGWGRAPQCRRALAAAVPLEPVGRGDGELARRGARRRQGAWQSSRGAEKMQKALTGFTGTSRGVCGGCGSDAEDYGSSSKSQNSLFVVSMVAAWYLEVVTVCVVSC